MLKNIAVVDSNTTLLTATTNTALTTMIFCNTDSVDHTITVFAVQSGGSANTASTIISELIIPAKDSYIWSANEKFLLGANDFIIAISNYATTGISCTITYIEY